MKLFKLHLVFGLLLLIIGILFDFLFVEWKISLAFKTDPGIYLNSFAKMLYDLTKFYMIVLGFLNIVVALLIPYFKSSTKIDWTICGLMIIGSILLLATGFWYAKAGPSLKWELRCTVLTIGLFAIVVGLGFEIYRILSGEKV